MMVFVWFFFFQAEDGIRDLVRSRGLGDVYKRQFQDPPAGQTIWYAVYDSVFDPGNNLLGVLGDYFSFEVTCSCDPNEKIVTPQGSTSQHYVPLNSQLNFTVNFQNTGNDTAFTVIIRDTLDTDLDLSTFEVTGSSNPMSTQMDVNGALQFTFDNILLPDSNIDEPGSHGFVNYRISPKTGLPDPTQITNTCLLYTSDAADERSSVDLGGRRIIKKKTTHKICQISNV